MNTLNEEPIRRDGPGTWNFDIILPQKEEINLYPIYPKINNKRNMPLTKRMLDLDERGKLLEDKVVPLTVDDLVYADVNMTYNEQDT